MFIQGLSYSGPDPGCGSFVSLCSSWGDGVLWENSVLHNGSSTHIKPAFMQEEVV